MEALFEALFLEIVNMSLRAGVVALIVMAFRLIFRKASKWIFCLLWAMVAFRLIFPVSIQSEYSALSSQSVLSDEFIDADVPVIVSGSEVIDEAVNEVLASSLATNAGDSANRTQVLSFILSHVWLLGMAGMLIYAIISSLILKHQISTATLLRQNIKQSEYVTSPFVLGIFRPTIYLPYNISKTDREQVILHEQAHIRRCDHLSKVLAFVLLSVYWFHPLIWISYILFCRDMEKACDEKVIFSMQEDDRRAYASALLNCASGRRSTVVSPLAFGEVGVKGRISGVMKYKKPALWLPVLVLIISAAAAVSLLTDPVSQEVKDTPLYYKNAASAVQQTGEMLIIYCPAEPADGEGTIQIGGAECTQVSEYLRSREWSRISGNRRLPSPGSIEFVIAEEYRVTVYDSRYAKVEYGEEVCWYRTGWGDYTAALALVHEPPHAVIDETDDAGHWLKCTVISDAGMVYLELEEHIGGDLAEESVTKINASHTGSILLYPDWQTDELIVSEHYYRRDGDTVQIEKQHLYLIERDESGAYVLDFSGREGSLDDVMYYVQGENGTYVFRIAFEEGAEAYSAADE